MERWNDAALLRESRDTSVQLKGGSELWIEIASLWKLESMAAKVVKKLCGA